MKKLIVSLISLTILAAVAWAGVIELPVQPAIAHMNTAIIGGGVPVAGGVAAASGYYDPDGDTSLGGWAPDPSWSEMDDGVRYNTTPTQSPEVDADFEARTYEFTIEEFTGTVTTARFWLYGYDVYDNGDVFQVNLTDDGTNWETAQSMILPNVYTNAAWLYVDFSVSWSSSTDFRGRLIRTGDGAWEDIRVWAVYVELNP